ncbi:MAG: sensor domain-containing diguanylate cyclase [Wenzhouxiangella sp.]|nr:sensor domain-containing diguanylate cyclase [Wenzhouxiangella sp.]
MVDQQTESKSDLSPVLAPSSGSLEDLVRPLLAVVEELTGMDSSYLTTVDPKAGVQRILYARNRGDLVLQEGLEVPWDESLCKRSLETGQMECAQVAEVWSDATTALDFGIRSYVGVPIRLADGVLFGTLCGASSEERRVSEDSVRVLLLLAALIERQLIVEHRANLAEQSLTRMAVAAEVGELCVGVADLATALNGTARLLEALPAWRQSWSFCMNEAQIVSANEERLPEALVSKIIAAVGEGLLMKHTEHLSPVLSDQQITPDLRAVCQEMGIPANARLALLTATASDRLSGGIVLVGNEHAPLETRDRQLLVTCSNFLSMLAARLQHQGMLEATNLALSIEAGQDALTGLPNRRRLLSLLERTLQAARHDGRQVFVAFIDLDNFKRINDDHGHDAGDLFLISIARHLVKGLRADDIVGRYGGDEFVVISSTVAGRSGTEICRNLVDRIDQAIVGRHELGSFCVDYKGASIGVATWRGESATELLRNADETMYKIKKQRSGRTHQNAPT